MEGCRRNGAERFSLPWSPPELPSLPPQTMGSPKVNVTNPPMNLEVPGNRALLLLRLGPSRDRSRVQTYNTHDAGIPQTGPRSPESSADLRSS